MKWRSDISKIISPFPYDSLKEGPYFVNDLRWEMISYMPHKDHKYFLKVTDTEILKSGRNWLTVNAPIYVRERWIRANSGKSEEKVSTSIKVASNSDVVAISEPGPVLRVDKDGKAKK